MRLHNLLMILSIIAMSFFNVLPCPLAHMVQLEVDQQDHELDEDVSFHVCVIPESFSPSHCDVYAYIVYPDGSFECLGASWGSPGNTNQIIPILSNWEVVNLQGPFSLDMSGFAVGNYALGVALTESGTIDAGRLEGFDVVEFTFYSSCSASNQIFLRMWITNIYGKNRC